MREQISTAVALRLLLLDLEVSLGVAKLSEGERNMLTALILSGGLGSSVKPGVLRSHSLTAGLTHPTYHRVLRMLLERGLVVYQTGQAGERGYTLVDDFASCAEEGESRSA